MFIRSLIGAALIVGGAIPAVAAPAEIDYPRHSLGYAAMVARDYVTAERQLRARAKRRPPIPRDSDQPRPIR